MKRMCAVLAAWGLAALPASAASPDPKDLTIPPQELSKARDLVRQLGSEVYKEREQAQDELAKMGRSARKPLAEALAAEPNPEIRFRSAQLLPRAEAADLQARIDTFLADTEVKFEHDLPGWALLRKEVGGEKSTRELYVEAIKTPANLELLTALGQSDEVAGRAIADRRMSLFLQQNPGVFGRGIGTIPMAPKQPTLPDIAVLLLAESVVASKDIPRPGPFNYVTGAQFVQYQPAMNAVNNPDGTPHGKPYRQIFIKWIETRTAVDDLNNLAWMASSFRQIKETGALLRRIVTTDGVVGHAKAQAMGILLTRGKEELPIIRTQLKNDTGLQTGRQQIAPGVTIDLQVRDVAVALVLHSDGQDLKKFGYEMQAGLTQAQIVQNYWGYGFKSDEDRAAGHKKFAEYEVNKAKEPPKKDEPAPKK